MGLFDHLFKSKSPPSEENSVETGNKPSEPAKHSEPAARGVTPSRADPAGFLHPKNFVPRGMAPLGPQKSGAISNVRKPGAPATPAAPPVDEIVLTLGDVLSRIPSPYLKLGQHDPKRELRFSINDLSSDIARGRAAVPLSRIAQLVPDIFVKEISADEDTEIRLPLQKLVEQIGLLRSRPAGERGTARQSVSSSSAGTTLAPPSFKVEFPAPLMENAAPGPDTLSGMLSSVDPVFELKPAEGSVFLRPTQEPTFELKPSAELTGSPFTLAPETPPVAQPTIPSSEKSIAPETREVEPAARESSLPKEAPNESPKIEIGEFEKIFAQFDPEPPAQTSKIESVTPELPPAAAVEVSSVASEPPVAEKGPSLVEAAAPSIEAAPVVVEKVGASAEPLRPDSTSTTSVVTEPILPSSESLAVNSPAAPEQKMEISSPVAAEIASPVVAATVLPVVAEVAAPRPAKEVVIMAAPVQLRPAAQTPPSPTPPADAARGLPVFESITPVPPVAPLVASDLPSADVVSRMEILAQPVEKAPVAADLAMPAPAASPAPPAISGEAISAAANSTPPAEVAPSSIPKLPFIERLLSAVLPSAPAPAPAAEIPVGSALSPLPPAAPVVKSNDLAAGSPVALDVPSVERVDVAPIPEAPVGLPVEATTSFESKPQSPLEPATPTLEPAISTSVIPGPNTGLLAPIAEPTVSFAEPARPVGENVSAAPTIQIPALSLVPDGGAPAPLPVEALAADAPREQDRKAPESAASPSRPEAEIVSRPVVEPRAVEPEPTPVAPMPSPLAPEKSAEQPAAQTAAPEAPRVMHPEFADPGREYAASVLARTILPKESIPAAPAGLAADGPKSDAAPESPIGATWPDRESVESAGTPVGLEATAPEAAPAPEKKIASAEPPPIPPVVVRESPAPVETGRERIQLSLAAILKQCPRELIVGELPAIPDSVRITLPFAPIDRQLVAGHVEISAVRFIAAIPFTYQKYFTARIGVKVPIPLEEVFQNLPNPSKEEPVVSGPAPQILAPAVPEDLVIPDEVIPPPPPIILAGPAPVEKSAEPVLAVEPQPASAITAPISTRPDEEAPSTTIPISAEPHVSAPAATAPSGVTPAFTIPVAAAPVSTTPVAVQPTTVVPPSETVPVADVPPLESTPESAVAAEKAPEPVADAAKPEVVEAANTPEALTPEPGVVLAAPAIPDAPVVEMVTLVAPSSLPAEPESIPVSAPAVTSLDLSMGHHIVPPPPIVIPEPEATEAEIPLAGTPFDGISEEGATQLAPIELAPAAKVETQSGPQPIEPSPVQIAQDFELHAPKPEHDAEEHGPKRELEVEAPLPEHHAAIQTPPSAPESETPPTISSELPSNVPIGDTPEPVTNMDEQVISPTELDKPAETTPKAEELPAAKDETLTPEVSAAAAPAGDAPTLSVAGETTQTFRLPQMIRPMIVLPPPIFGFNPTPSGTEESSAAEPENKTVEPEIVQDKGSEPETPAVPPVEPAATPEAPALAEAPVESAPQAADSPVAAAAEAPAAVVEAPAPVVADAAISSEPIQDSPVEVLPPLSSEATAISAEEKAASAPRTFVMEGQFVETPRGFVPPPLFSEPVAEAAPVEPAVPVVATDIPATVESAPVPEAPVAEAPVAPIAETVPEPIAETAPASPEAAAPTEQAPVATEVAPNAEAVPAPEETPTPVPSAAPVAESTAEPVPPVIEAPGAELASAAPVVEPAVSSDTAPSVAPIPAAEPDQLAASLGIPEAAPAAPVEGTAGESPLLHLPRIIEQFADAEVLPPPALPLRRFDQDALQALFMTEEVLDLPKISRMAAQLPGVHACVIATRDQACTGGTLPEGFDLAALLGLAPRVGEAAGRMPIGDLKHFTLYGERYSVSFFARNGLSLCAVHRPRSFVPGVREKLVAIADELSK